MAAAARKILTCQAPTLALRFNDRNPSQMGRQCQGFSCAIVPEGAKGWHSLLCQKVPVHREPPARKPLILLGFFAPNDFGIAKAKWKVLRQTTI